MPGQPDTSVAKMAHGNWNTPLAWPTTEGFCMQRKRSWIFQFVMMALSVPALHAQEKPNGFYLTSPLVISSGYDRGFLAGYGTFSDNVTILAEPTVAWMRSTHRTEFSVDYQLESETFANNSRLNAVNHLSAMRYRYQINSRWSAQAGNLFLSTMDPNRAVANSL